MHMQYLGTVVPSRELIQKRCLPSREELALFKSLSKATVALTWTTWERADVKGFKAVSISGFEIEIRLVGPCIYGDTSRRWSRFGIVPSEDKKWYHIKILDPFRHSGKKHLIDYAAPEKDLAFDSLKSTHDSLLHRKDLKNCLDKSRTVKNLENTILSCA